MSNYQKKYLKYKQKYANLTGGAIMKDITNKINALRTHVTNETNEIFRIVNNELKTIIDSKKTPASDTVRSSTRPPRQPQSSTPSSTPTRSSTEPKIKRYGALITLTLKPIVRQTISQNKVNITALDIYNSCKANELKTSITYRTYYDTEKSKYKTKVFYYKDEKGEYKLGNIKNVAEYGIEYTDHRHIGLIEFSTEAAIEMDFYQLEKTKLYYYD